MLNMRTTPTPPLPPKSTARQKIVNFSRRLNTQRRRRPPVVQAPETIEESPEEEEDDDDLPTAADQTNRASTTSADPSSLSSLSPGSYHLRPPLHRREAARKSASSTATATTTTTTASSTAGTASRLHAASAEFMLPDLPWLCGTWHVTHSTLPLWRDKRNVRITYTRLPGDKLDDLVTYQGLGGDEVKSVRGIDTPGKGKKGGYVWRGKGWLKVATSRWEVLGWGGGGRTSTAFGECEAAEQWVVTYFAKTVFTPAGIDVYSRRKEGLSPRTVRRLKVALMRLEEAGFGRKGGSRVPRTEWGRLVDELFEVRRDEGRDTMYP